GASCAGQACTPAVRRRARGRRRVQRRRQDRPAAAALSRAMNDVFLAPAPARVPVRGGGTFPVRRIYCVGRNFADHAREMGATAPASKAERGTPTFFLKPADAIVTDGDVPYPPGTRELHHEVE